MTDSPNTFPQIVRQAGGVPLLFETIPPRRDATDEKVAAWCDQIVAALEKLPVVGVNVPEVRDEARNGERTYTYIKRMKPRKFAQLLRASFSRPIELIINRVVVYRTLSQQKEWLENSYRDWGIRNLILVGGESSRVAYQGPSVSAMARLITEEVNSHLPQDERWFCGGITIPGRRSSIPERDEPSRLVQKAGAGIEFFTTQIIYEADSICRLVSDYARLCEEKETAPKRIFISFTPVRLPKQIEFVRWLGVDIPPGIEGELLHKPDRVGAQSIEICCRLFEQIQDFNASLPRPVPLGLNVSPLIRSNFDLGVELAERLAQLIR